MNSTTNPPATLRRLRAWTAFFIFGLVVSGLTAIPLETELAVLERLAGQGSDGLAGWIHRVAEGLRETNAKFPFLAYGTDWLAFGHLVIAVAFVGAWRDPVRNKWLFQFGMIACVAVVPWALGFGELRGIPLGWRLIDCAFGVAGFSRCGTAGGWRMRRREEATRIEGGTRMGNAQPGGGLTGAVRG